MDTSIKTSCDKIDCFFCLYVHMSCLKGVNDYRGSGGGTSQKRTATSPPPPSNQPAAKIQKRNEDDTPLSLETTDRIKEWVRLQGVESVPMAEQTAAWLQRRKARIKQRRWNNNMRKMRGRVPHDAPPRKQVHYRDPPILRLVANDNEGYLEVLDFDPNDQPSDCDTEEVEKVVNYAHDQARDDHMPALWQLASAESPDADEEEAAEQTDLRCELNRVFGKRAPFSLGTWHIVKSRVHRSDGLHSFSASRRPVRMLEWTSWN